MFSRIAGTYDEINHKLSMGKDIQWRKDSVRQLLKGGFKPGKVLDLCAGTGDFALALVAEQMECKVLLLDFSREMLKLARTKTRGIQSRVDLLEADALKLPVQDMAFDAVLCGFGVRNLDSAEAGLQEVARVLKPGGRLVVLDFFKPQGFLPNLFYSFYMKYVVTRVGGSISKDPDAYTYLPDSAKAFLTVDDFGKLMEKCGFKEVGWETRSMGVAASVMGTRK
jgi:demethylmenaquinone methyltransferase / 2-methoxy-6-polyprenyl-1,4-benzoquinol methylase